MIRAKNYENTCKFVKFRWLKNVAQKWTKCNFSTTDRGLLTKISEFTDEGLSNSP